MAINIGLWKANNPASDDTWIRGTLQSSGASDADIDAAFAAYYGTGGNGLLSNTTQPTVTGGTPEQLNISGTAPVVDGPLINSYDQIHGANTTPAETATPATTISDEDIRWWAVNSYAGDGSAAALMSQYGITSDRMASVLGISPEEARRRFSQSTNKNTIIDTVDTAQGAVKDHTNDTNIKTPYDTKQDYDFGKTKYDVSDKVDGPAASIDPTKVSTAEYNPAAAVSIDTSKLGTSTYNPGAASTVDTSKLGTASYDAAAASTVDTSKLGTASYDAAQASTIDTSQLSTANYQNATHIDPRTGVKTVGAQEIAKAELAEKAKAGNALAGVINKGDVNQVTTDSNQLAQGRLGGMLSQNSPYLRDARNRAMRTANSRGLLNSAMAAGMGEEAAIAAAAPIAAQDAQTYGTNARQNASELNKALDTNAQLYGTQAQLDTNVNVNNQNLTQDVYNVYAGQQNNALFKNQDAANQANITNAQLGTETALRNADGTLKAGMFNAGETNKALGQNAQLLTETALRNADGTLKAGMFNAGETNQALTANAQIGTQTAIANADGMLKASAANASETNKALGQNAQLETQASLANADGTLKSGIANASELNKALAQNAQLGTETSLQNAHDSMVASIFGAGEMNDALAINTANEQSLLELGITLETDTNKTTAGWNFQGMMTKYAAITDAEKLKTTLQADMTKLNSAQNFELIKAATIAMLDIVGNDNIAEKKMITDNFSNQLAIEFQKVVDAGVKDENYKKTIAAFIAGESEAITNIMMAADIPAAAKVNTIDEKQKATIYGIEMITYMHNNGDITELLRDPEAVGNEDNKLAYSNTADDRKKIIADTSSLLYWFNNPKTTQAQKDEAMADPELGAAITAALK